MSSPIESQASALRDELIRSATAIDPFPPFPGAVFAYGIEVELPPGSGLGCVVVGNDGGLYELQLGLDATRVELGADAVGSRHEELVPLKLPPAMFIVIARHAIEAVRRYAEGASAAR